MPLSTLPCLVRLKGAEVPAMIWPFFGATAQTSGLLLIGRHVGNALLSGLPLLSLYGIDSNSLSGQTSCGQKKSFHFKNRIFENQYGLNRHFGEITQEIKTDQLTSARQHSYIIKHNIQ